MIIKEIVIGEITDKRAAIIVVMDLVVIVSTRLRATKFTRVIRRSIILRVYYSKKHCNYYNYSFRYYVYYDRLND